MSTSSERMQAIVQQHPDTIIEIGTRQIVEVLAALAAAEDRIVQALKCMDESMYGDAEAPFRMRARLTGRAYGDYQSTDDYIEEQS